jgi:hypothetical protein
MPCLTETTERLKCLVGVADEVGGYICEPELKRGTANAGGAQKSHVPNILQNVP